MPVGSAKFGLMAAAGGGGGGFVAFGGIISQWMGAATVITDSSAANNNGTTTGVRYSTAATKSGTYGLHSVDFGDPPRGHVRAPTMSALGMTTAFTVSCWAKADAHPAIWSCLFGQTSTSSWADGFGLYVSNTNTISGFVNNYNSGNVADIVTFTNWNHYVLTYDGSDLKLYINGSLGDTNSTNSGTIASNAIGIADLNDAAQNYSYTWPGVSDEYGFWNEALTAAEITAIYNSGTPLSLSADSGNYASSANLKAYYKFEDPKTYRVHAFRGNGTFYVANGEADVDWLVVGGGGGGGQGYTGGSGGGHGGGGGAGAGITGTGYSVSAGTYAITVGVGGSGHAGSEGSGGQGGNSTALGTTAKGGGYASGGNWAVGGDSLDPGGGSSGGAGGAGGSGEGYREHGTSGTYGNDGGSSIGQPVPAGGGGGGAGGAAQDGQYANPSTGGYGGAGSAGHYGITASTVGLMGGGGGTGGAGNGAGGSYGGGAGNATPEGGAVNSGSGGGGGYHSSRYSGDGGAGIVIIRYEVS